jgi:hypothetical protein
MTWHLDVIEIDVAGKMTDGDTCDLDLLFKRILGGFPGLLHYFRRLIPWSEIPKGNQPFRIIASCRRAPLSFRRDE